MDIYPTGKQFLEWSRLYSRVPISGEKQVLAFSPAFLFKNIFDLRNEAFLFESGKGSSDISRYSFMGISNQSSVKIFEDYSAIDLNNNSEQLIGTVNEGWDTLNFKNDVPFVFANVTN